MRDNLKMMFGINGNHVLTPTHHVHLAPFCQRPQSGTRYPVTVTRGSWRSEIYNVPGRFAHLADVQRFTGDLRALL